MRPMSNFIQLETLAVTWADSTSSRPTASDPLQPFGSAPSNGSFQGVSGQSQRSGCLDMSLRIPSKGE